MASLESYAVKTYTIPEHFLPVSMVAGLFKTRLACSAEAEARAAAICLESERPEGEKSLDHVSVSLLRGVEASLSLGAV